MKPFHVKHVLEFEMVKNNLHTIGQHSAERSPRQALEATLTNQEKQRVIGILVSLSSHYWRPDFSPSQAAAMWLDYCADLAVCRVDEIEVACREYRLNPKNQFFPKSSQLREIVFANRKHREELARMGNKVHAESRPLWWWAKPRNLWAPHWQESEVPAGNFVRDPETGKLREPGRLSLI